MSLRLHCSPAHLPPGAGIAGRCLTPETGTVQRASRTPCRGAAGDEEPQGWSLGTSHPERDSQQTFVARGKRLLSSLLVTHPARESQGQSCPFPCAGRGIQGRRSLPRALCKELLVPAPEEPWV